jgi:hypothetical protein
MKIAGPNTTRQTSGAKKTNKGHGATSSFADALNGSAEQDGVDDIAAHVGVGAVGAVDALLSLQEVDDALHAPKSKDRAMARGEALLDRLDDIRVGLLTGHMAQSQLVRLAQTIAEQRDMIDDPNLQSILDDIELRAAVELAKFHRARRG